MIYVLVLTAVLVSGDTDIETASYKSPEACQQAGEDFLALLNIQATPVVDVEVTCLKSQEL